MMSQRIYLDHAATTPMRPESIAAVSEGMARWANPSSPHAEGRAARAALEEARARIKAALGWTGELIFTSGASEALWIALNRAKVERRIVSAVEHDAVFRAAPGAEVLPVLTDGTVDSSRLGELLQTGGRASIALQHVNSETGIMQPVDEIAAFAKSSGHVLIADCAQSAGRQPLPDADLIVVSAHKLGGPPGIGALLIRDMGVLDPVGGQEFGYRAGTENLPAALGFAAALDAGNLVSSWPANHALIDAAHRLEVFVQSAGGELLGNASPRSMLIRSIAMPGVPAAAQLIQLDQAGFAVSAGSACSSGTLKQSRVLQALGVKQELATNTIRVS
ncbi:MAG: aminotransferase class V-fold PLP-dependent enzyme, partial [Sphingomonas sp.]|nr:aminotransferase class V-fold PLP-dependent enzyme [Sphingomonas sp.]